MENQSPNGLVIKQLLLKFVGNKLIIQWRLHLLLQCLILSPGCPMLYQIFLCPALLCRHSFIFMLCTVDFYCRHRNFMTTWRHFGCQIMKCMMFVPGTILGGENLHQFKFVGSSCSSSLLMNIWSTL